jgi:hypothetical protein
MKIYEVCSPFKTFLATVRVVIKHGSFIGRTTVSAESSSHACLMLSHLYGAQNVIMLVEIISDSFHTEQIHAQASLTPEIAQRRACHSEGFQILPSKGRKQISPSRQRVSMRPIASPIKRDIVRDLLAKQFIGQSNIVMPSIEDVQIAKRRVETSLKRANLDFESAADEAERKRERQKRRQHADANPAEKCVDALD